MGITVKKILVRFNMEKINKFLLMVISMVAIMITAVGIDKGIQFYNNRKWEKERIERYRQSDRKSVV